MTIKIPEEIKGVIDGITEPLYVEALRGVARNPRTSLPVIANASEAI